MSIRHNTGLLSLISLLAISASGGVQAQVSLLQTFMDKGNESQAKGDFFEAKKQYEAALFAAEKLAENDQNLEKAMAALATLDARLGDLDAAEKLWKRLLSLKEKSGIRDNGEIAAIMMRLSAVNRQQGRYAEAESLAEKALNIAKTLRKEPCSEWVPFLNNLAVIYLDRQKFAAAETMAKSAITHCDKSQGASKPMSDALSVLSDIYIAQGKFEEAEKFSQRAMAMREALYGKESGQTAEDRIRLATIFADQGKFEKAEGLLSPLLNQKNAKVKVSDDDRLKIARALAKILVVQEKNSDAIPLLEQAHKLSGTVMGSTSSTFASISTELGLAQMEVGNYPQAEINLKKALAIDEQKFGRDNPGIAPDLNNIGLLYLQQGKYDLAESLYHRAYDLCAKALGDGHLDVATCLNNLGFVERNRRNSKEAEQYLRKGLTIREKSLGAKHPLVAQNLVILADVLKAQGKTSEAIDHLTRAIEIEKAASSEEMEITSMQREVADALFAEKKYSEAATLYRQVVKTEENLGGTENGALASDLTGLSDSLNALGETSEANEIKKRADRIKATLPGYNATADTVSLHEETSLTPARPIKDKWALVIGISSFKDPSLNLKYSAKDATDFKNYLVTEAGFAPDHVKLLTDHQATRENIVAHLGEKWLGRAAGPDDLVVLFMSSHGSAPKKEVNANFIVPYEGSRENIVFTGIPMQWLTAGIQSVLHADRTLLLLDVCHGGAIGGAKAIGREFDFNPSNINVGPGQLILVSSMDDQVSWESKRYHNGVFTHHLIDGLRQKGKQTNMGETFTHLKDKVEEEVLRDRAILQTPMMFKKIAGGTQIVLAAPGTSPRPGLSAPLSLESHVGNLQSAKKSLGEKTQIRPVMPKKSPAGVVKKK